MKYSKNQKLAKEFIAWYMDKKQFDPYFVGNRPGCCRRPRPGTTTPSGRRPKAYVVPGNRQGRRTSDMPAHRVRRNERWRNTSCGHVREAIQGNFARRLASLATAEMKKVYGA